MLPAHIFLDQLNLPYETGEFPSATEKGAANVANRFGFKERQMVKTLIFETDQDERLLVMVGGDQSVISGYLKKAAGSRNIRLASFEAVKTLTGYEIGSIPPFSWQPPGFRSFLEASLMEEPILGVGAGVWGQEIFITPQNLAIASRAHVINLTDRNRPIFTTE